MTFICQCGIDHSFIPESLAFLDYQDLNFGCLVWFIVLLCLQGDHKLVLTHRWQFLRLTGVKCLELCLAQNTFSIHGLSLPLGRKQNSQSNPLSLPSSFDVWNWPLNYVEFRGANPQAVENYNFWHSKTLNSP